MTKKNKNNDKPTGEKIIEVDYEDEMQQSYIDYAMSVIIQRALPDVRDGLKPVHRRILYAMNGLKNFPEHAHKKSARITGETLGKYHPHGDTSVYEAMVRMAQDFSLNHTLVDGHGNFGSIDGDRAASHRYTEARLTPLAMNMLGDLEKGVVDFNKNFDNTLLEPDVLPAKFPNLLINGSTGIAVGMTTNIPPHNFEETMMAVIDHLDDINSDPLNRIKGPDFPTGGIIVNEEELEYFYKKGKGKIKIRAKMEVEDIGYGKKNIVVTEIPYTSSGSKTNLINSIINLVNNKKLEELTDVRDESGRDGLRIVLEVRKGVDIERLKNKLYKKTKLEDTFGMIMRAVIGKKPKVFSLKEMIAEYSEFLKEVNKRELEFDLDKAKKREEIVEGYIKAIDAMDVILEVFRGSKNVLSVKKCLINGDTADINFKTKKSEKIAKSLLFTERQAEAIATMQLQRLVGLELDKALEEIKGIKKDIASILKILNNEKEFIKFIKKDIMRVLKNNKRDRKTEITQKKIKTYTAQPEVEEDYVVLIDKLGYIKTVDEQSVIRAGDESLDDYHTIIKAVSTDTLLVFYENGDLQQVKIKDIPFGKIRDKGTPIEMVFNSKKYLLITPLNTANEDLIMITKKGLIKRVERSEFNFNRKDSYSTKFKKGDSLFNVCEIKEGYEEIEVVSTDKNKLRFMLDEVSVQKRNARGVTSIKMGKDDEISEFIIEESTRKHKKKRGSKGKK